jgi:predicted ATPase
MQLAVTRRDQHLGTGGRLAFSLHKARTVLDWASSPGGDTELGVALTIAAVPLWRLLSLMEECRSEAVYGRCDNRRDDLADFCGPRAHLVLRV